MCMTLDAIYDVVDSYDVCGIGDAGGTAVAEALTVNTTLQSITLSGEWDKYAISAM